MEHGVDQGDLLHQSESSWIIFLWTTAKLLSLATVQQSSLSRNARNLISRIPFVMSENSCANLDEPTSSDLLFGSDGHSSLVADSHNCMQY